MSKLIGVTNILYSNKAKSQALFFDSLTHPLASRVREDLNYNVMDLDNKTREEMLWLFEKEVFIDVTEEAGFSPENLFHALMVPLSNGVRVSEIEKQLDSFVESTQDWSSTLEMLPVQSSSQILVHPTGMFVLPDNQDPRIRVENMFNLINKTATPAARLLATWLRKYKDVNAYPALSEFTDEFSKNEKLSRRKNENIKTDVLNIVIENIPTPDESVTWEQILDFRNDPDSQGKILALRNWINKTARSGASYNEIQDELEFLLYNYERHMELHKMKHNVDTFEAIVVTTAEVLEGIAKLNLADSVRKLFSIKHRRVELLEAELNNPGAEIAYIYKSREKFSKKRLRHKKRT